MSNTVVAEQDRAAKFAAASAAPAWYSLRRTLPLWSFEQNLQELIDYLPKYGVNEVIVKVDTEEFSHGQPPLDWVKAYQPRLFKIKQELEKIGIVYSVNPWITVGHCDRGRNCLDKLPGMRPTVGHDGIVCTSCACPLCPVWRKNTADVWSLYAETRPHIIWIEDDIRTFNHAPVKYGCFCEEHLRLFSQRIGQKVDRQQVVDAILREGEPHPWRAEYMRMQGEMMVETVRFLSRTVHAVSPETSLGLMSSGPRAHNLEGRDWKALAEAMADGRPLYSRAPMGNYFEESLRGFYYSHDMIKLTRHVLPAGVIEQTEVENVPFTRYSKSLASTFIEIGISFAFGSHGVTLNLFDHAGTPMQSEPGYGRMLGENKPYFNAMAEAIRPAGVYRGVGLLFNDRESLVKQLPPHARYPQLESDGASVMLMLEALGIPTTYSPEKVSTTVGQQLRAFSDDEIRKLLSHGHGLLLDAVAARVIFERGFGELIGLEAIGESRNIDTQPNGPYSAEEFFNPDFGGAARRYLTATIPDLGSRPSISLMTPAARATIVSQFVDPDARRSSIASYAFENASGGRAFVIAYDLATAFGGSFNHPFRADLMRGAINWLAHDQPAVHVQGDGVYPLAFRKDLADESIVGMFNLTLDEWPGATFTLGDNRTVAGVKVLEKDGQWHSNRQISVSTAGDGRITIRCDKPIPYLHPLILRVGWK